MVIKTTMISHFISDFFKAQLLTPSLTGRLAISAISLLFVDGFGRSLRFCHLEFDEKAFLIVSWHIPVFLGRGG